MKYFNIILGVTALILLAILAYKLIDNSKPREVKDCVVTITVTAEQKAANGRSVRITRTALEDALRQSAYAARQEAQNEYDKNFSTLLTILTIFGIAWPLVVAFAQYKFNERELDKIQVAEKNASDALTKANAASDSATQALADATKATTDAHDALDKAQKALKENKNTDEVIREFLEAFKSSNRSSWQGQVAIYSQLGLVLRRANIGDQAIYNLLKIMSLHCECSRVRFGNSMVVCSSDITRINNVLSNFSIEGQRDCVSEINKGTIDIVKTEIESLLSHNQDPEIKKQLEEILQKVCGIYTAYKQLVPDGTENDLKA